MFSRLRLEQAANMTFPLFSTYIVKGNVICFQEETITTLREKNTMEKKKYNHIKTLEEEGAKRIREASKGVKNID